MKIGGGTENEPAVRRSKNLIAICKCFLSLDEEFSSLLAQGTEMKFDSIPDS